MGDSNIVGWVFLALILVCLLVWVFIKPRRKYVAAIRRYEERHESDRETYTI